jgi:hypothetical protein
MERTPITVRRYTDFAEMKADEYRYWQSRPAHERLDTVAEMIEAAYALKGWEISRTYQEYKDLLSAFHARGVKYLVVGGFAASGRPQDPADPDAIRLAQESHGP